MDLEKLEKLSKLHGKGILTDEEFIQKKEEVLRESEKQNSQKDKNPDYRDDEDFYKSEITESLMFLGVESLTFISYYVYLLFEKADSALYLLIFLAVLCFISFAFAWKYARYLHNLYYASQNLVWHKDFRTLNRDFGILPVIVLVAAPFIIPITVLVMWIKLFRLKKKQKG